MLSVAVIPIPVLAQQTPQLPDLLPPAQPPQPLPIEPIPEPEVQREPPLNVPEVNFKDSIQVTGFQFVGNTVIDDQTLEALAAQFMGRTLDLSELLQVRTLVTDYYESQGFTTSGAFILVADNLSFDTTNANIVIRVIEGKLQELKIVGAKHLQGYIRQRVVATQSGVFNEKQLFQSLKQLQLNQRIDRIAARLDNGSVLDQSILTLEVDPAPSSSVKVNLNNYGSPTVGTFTRSLAYENLNVFGLGDTFRVSYSNATGSNGIAVSYGVPINAQDGYAEISYSYDNSHIIEPPFDALDISATSQSFRFSVQQPVFRQISDNTIQELVVGLAATHEKSESFLFNQRFPVFGGADDQGRISTTVLSLFQNYSRIDGQQSLLLNSTFNFGLGGSTENSQFFSWQGNALWARRLPLNLTLITRGNLQFADRQLLSSQQASLGGINTVRGFRTNQIVSDNQASGSVELQIPVYNGSKGSLVIYPFVDAGVGYNNSEDFLENTGVLASVGFGLRYQYKNLALRFDYGYGFEGRSERRRTLQENGATLSLEYTF